MLLGKELLKTFQKLNNCLNYVIESSCEDLLFQFSYLTGFCALKYLAIGTFASLNFASFWPLVPAIGVIPIIVFG